MRNHTSSNLAYASNLPKHWKQVRYSSRFASRFQTKAKVCPTIQASKSWKQKVIRGLRRNWKKQIRLLSSKEKSAVRQRTQRKIPLVMGSSGGSIKIMRRMKSLSRLLSMINSLFKSLVSFQECCIQPQTQGGKSEVAAKLNLIFKHSSIRKRAKKFWIIKFTNLIRYLQMITKIKHAVSLVKFHQSLPKILEYQNQINLQYSAMGKKEKPKVIIKFHQEKQKSQNLIVKYNF